MQSNTNFSITRTYSSIPGFQEESKDVYSLKLNGDGLLVEFQSDLANNELREEVHVSGVSFDDIRRLLFYMSENAVRHDSWKNVILDYCFQRGAVAW